MVRDFALAALRADVKSKTTIYIKAIREQQKTFVSSATGGKKTPKLKLAKSGRLTDFVSTRNSTPLQAMVETALL